MGTSFQSLDAMKQMEYHAAPDQDHGNPKPFLALIADIVKDSFQPYWHSLGIQAPETDPL